MQMEEENTDLRGRGCEDMDFIVLIHNIMRRRTFLNTAMNNRAICITVSELN